MIERIDKELKIKKETRKTKKITPSKVSDKVNISDRKLGHSLFFQL